MALLKVKKLPLSAPPPLAPLAPLAPSIDPLFQDPILSLCCPVLLVLRLPPTGAFTAQI